MDDWLRQRRARLSYEFQATGVVRMEAKLKTPRDAERAKGLLETRVDHVEARGRLITVSHEVKRGTQRNVAHNTVEEWVSLLIRHGLKSSGVKCLLEQPPLADRTWWQLAPQAENFRFKQLFRQKPDFRKVPTRLWTAEEAAQASEHAEVGMRYTKVNIFGAAPWDVKAYCFLALGIYLFQIFVDITADMRITAATLAVVVAVAISKLARARTSVSRWRFWRDFSGVLVIVTGAIVGYIVASQRPGPITWRGLGAALLVVAMYAITISLAASIVQTLGPNRWAILFSAIVAGAGFLGIHPIIYQALADQFVSGLRAPPATLDVSFLGLMLTAPRETAALSLVIVALLAVIFWVRNQFSGKALAYTFPIVGLLTLPAPLVTLLQSVNAAGALVIQNNLATTAHFARRVCIELEPPPTRRSGQSPYIVVPTAEGHLLVGPLDATSTTSLKLPVISTPESFATRLPNDKGSCEEPK